MHSAKIPTRIIWAVVAVCVLPFALNILGIDFGSPKVSLDPSGLVDSSNIEIVDRAHRFLAGSFTHTLLEWTAFCAAFFTVILAFVHFQIVKDIVTPIIAVALFWSGCMDAFHTLAADRLIEATAPNDNLIPFTWAICRVFNALILITGVVLIMTFKEKKWSGQFAYLATVSVAFGAIAYGIIYVCATSEQLPQTMFPDSLITRPWDVAPLLLFAFAGLVLFPVFYRRNPSVFAHALIIGMIPEVASELHMAFGSVALFDNHFNIAHFLKIFAYFVPFVGLCLDYVQAHQIAQFALERLSRTNEELRSEVVTRLVVQEALEVEREKLATANVELTKAHGELYQVAITDELTGIYNRRYLVQRFNEEVERAERYDSPLSILLIDIDHFKQINDQYGHQAGDQVLRLISSLINTMARTSDIVGRYGGEEFLIVLPNADIEEARRVAERFCEEIRKHSFVVEHETLHVACSIGAAELIRGSSDAFDLFKRADKALYEAKDLGRDRVQVVR